MKWVGLVDYTVEMESHQKKHWIYQVNVSSPTDFNAEEVQDGEVEDDMPMWKEDLQVEYKYGRTAQPTTEDGDDSVSGGVWRCVL